MRYISQQTLWALLLTLFCLASFSHSASANPKYASIVIDADTGRIYHQRHADKRLHPASLTKMMTLVMVFDALESGRLTLNSRIPISRHAAGMVPSKLGLPSGSSIQVKDAIAALVTKSANDVAVAIAEKLGGTEARFAWHMTSKARQIGMTQTVFKNASGLHHREQISTARDMARLARYIIRKYPAYYPYFSMQRFSYRGKTYENHNRLMRRYAGMDGMKTGYISAAGFNLVASAVQDNRRLIGVVFGGKTSRSRNDHMEALLNTAFGKVQREQLIANAIQTAPQPSRKPTDQMQDDSQLAALKTVADTGLVFGRNAQSGEPVLLSDLIGQGDVDPEMRERFMTGLVAATAHTGTQKTLPFITELNSTPAKKESFYAGDWSIQVGAYTSRVASETAIQKAKVKLAQADFGPLTGRIVPARRSDGVLFRARLTGLDEKAANDACAQLKDCLIVPPR